MDSTQLPQTPPSLPPAQEQKNALKVFTIIEKILHIFITIYFLCVIYRKLRINGVDIGTYLMPISSIPFLLIFLVTLFIQYILQNLKTNTRITKEKIETDLIKTVATTMTVNPLEMFLKYLWNSIKTILKQIMISLLLIIPIMLVFSIIQLILTGKSDVTASY